MKYRKRLPQLHDGLFATDGGLETTLVFLEGIELPGFAAFPLLRDEDGLGILRRYFLRYIELARAHRLGFVLEAPTWRANPDWGEKLGYDRSALAAANRQAIDLLSALRGEHERTTGTMVLSGNLGPRGDGYVPGARMSAREAEDYHDFQVRVFADTDADMVAGFTLNYVEEGVGIARAAKRHGLPVAISFTVETDGRLPSGATLGEAITATDAQTAEYPAYYMINCAHPTHFEPALREAGAWRRRIRGLRANASRLSHAELDAATALDAGDPLELGGQYREMRRLLPELAVVGGCCGTDHRHVEAICEALA